MSQPFPYRSAFSLGLYPTLPPQPLLCVISVYHFHTLPFSVILIPWSLWMVCKMFVKGPWSLYHTSFALLYISSKIPLCCRTMWSQCMSLLLAGTHDVTGPSSFTHTLYTETQPLPHPLFFSSPWWMELHGCAVQSLSSAKKRGLLCKISWFTID